LNECSDDDGSERREVNYETERAVDVMMLLPLTLLVDDLF
jgi:hypothetical protein